MDALLVFAVTIAFMIFAIGHTGRMALLERRGQLAHRGSVRRRRQPASTAPSRTA